MKRFFLKHPAISVLAFISLLTVSLVACNGQEAEAGLPEGFDKVTVDKKNIAEYAEVLRHKETRCYYVVVSGTQAVAVEQMFVEKNGVSVPYCEDRK